MNYLVDFILGFFKIYLFKCHSTVKAKGVPDADQHEIDSFDLAPLLLSDTMRVTLLGTLAYIYTALDPDKAKKTWAGRF